MHNVAVISTLLLVVREIKFTKPSPKNYSNYFSVIPFPMYNVLCSMLLNLQQQKWLKNTGVKIIAIQNGATWLARLKSSVTFQLLAGAVPLSGRHVRVDELPLRRHLGLPRRRGRALLRQLLPRRKIYLQKPEVVHRIRPGTDSMKILSNFCIVSFLSKLFFKE
jgi:hypothetical protein